MNFLKVFAIFVVLSVSSVVAEDDISELFADEEDSQLEVMDASNDTEPQLLGGGPININIQPVTDEDEIDCEGQEDGVLIQKEPKECLHFYLCIQGSGHKVECPRIPHQLYFNPVSKACGSVSETFCMEWKPEAEDEDEAKIDNENQDDNDDHEPSKEDEQSDDNEENYDETEQEESEKLTEQRTEL